jgi:hypothetical protein
MKAWVSSIGTALPSQNMQGSKARHSVWHDGGVAKLNADKPDMDRLLSGTMPWVWGASWRRLCP